MLLIALNNTDDKGLGKLPVIGRLFSLLVIRDFQEEKKKNQKHPKAKHKTFAAFV